MGSLLQTIVYVVTLAMFLPMSIIGRFYPMVMFDQCGLVVLADLIKEGKAPLLAETVQSAVGTVSSVIFVFVLLLVFLGPRSSTTALVLVLFHGMLAWDATKDIALHIALSNGKSTMTYATLALQAILFALSALAFLQSGTLPAPGESDEDRKLSRKEMEPSYTRLKKAD